MAKTGPEELSELVTDELVTYLQDGTINADGLAESFDFTGLDIEDFDQLKQLHFVLHNEVVSYVAEIQRRLRRIKTEQKRHQEITRGEVRGSINWGQTLAQRTKIGYEDRTMFVIDDPTVELDIPENRIVKRLLDWIETPLRRDVEGIDHGWGDSWSDGDIVALQQTLAHNVYLNELPEPDDIEVTDRELSSARQSRHELYSEGARLYQLYDDFMNERFDREEVRDFLRDTIISPDREFRIFELFCLFGVIRGLRSGALDVFDVESDDLRLRRIRPGDEPVARMEDDEIAIEVFYDVGGTLEFFEAYPKPSDLEVDEVPDSIYRHSQALEMHDAAVDTFLGRDERRSFYRGRPDMVAVLNRKHPWGEEVEQVLIGEVKYTESPSTFATGLRELVEYLHFAREEGRSEWLFENELDEGDLKGILCTDDVDTRATRYGEVRHIGTNRLRSLFEPLEAV